MADLRFRIRAFIAIDPPQIAKDTLASISANLKELGLTRVTWVGLSDFHITVKFLGDIVASQIEELLKAMTCVARTVPVFALSLGSVGVFPHSRSPRVLWVTLDQDLDSLFRMHQELEEAMLELGISREDRSFHPHITLGRISNEDRMLVGKRLPEAFEQIAIPSSVVWQVQSFSLMSSVFVPGVGVAYRRIAGIGLTGAL